MNFDKQLQNKILDELLLNYPNFVYINNNFIKGYSKEDLTGNAYYLYESGMVDAQIHREVMGIDSISCKININGIRFLNNE